MWLKTLVAAKEPAVGLEEVKSNLRIDSDTEDPMLTLYLMAAIQMIEEGTARCMMTQQFTQVMDTFPGQEDRLYSLETPGAGNSPIILLRGPVSSVDAIRYVNVNTTDGVTFTTWQAVNYLNSLTDEPARITPLYPLVYPITYPRMNAVEVDFTAGYAEQALIPAAMKMLVHLVVAHFYENREPVAQAGGANLADLPKNLQAMILGQAIHYSDDLTMVR